MTDSNVEVELEPGLRNYALPEAPTMAEAAEAVRESWRFLEVGPIRLTAPLLAAAYAAPLSEIVVPDFAIWLWGGTGSYKSTLAALNLCHFGDFSEVDLPLSFESTSNALERSLFLAKDVLTVVDDWRPGVTRGDSEDMERKAQRLLRGVGNRQGRNRMTAETALRKSYPPRGAVVATAEALPEGPAFESAAQRALCLNVSRDDVDRGVLSRLQQNKGSLPVAMAGYIQQLGARYDTLSKTLPAARDALRDELRTGLAGAHPRTPTNAATLILGLTGFAEYSVLTNAMSESRAKELFERGKRGIVEAARAHVEATSGGDPADRFFGILGTLFDAGRAHLRDRTTGEAPPDWAQVGWTGGSSDAKNPWREPNGDFVGWADEDHVYLDKDAAFAAVSGFAQRGAVPFGIKPNILWNALARRGTSLADERRVDTTAKVQGKTKRVVQIPRSALRAEAAPTGDAGTRV